MRDVGSSGGQTANDQKGLTMLTIKINTDNAAFGGCKDDAAQECAKILRQVRDNVLQGCYSGTLRDSNGNTVGNFRLTKKASK